MSGSTFGKNFKVTTWGESHGKAMGVVIDGVPAGIKLEKEFIDEMVSRRKPQNFELSTPRVEKDDIEILSGVFNDITLGTPICIMVRNVNTKHADYDNIAKTYRPGHGDYTYDAKYGYRDYRGGGRSSGRETISRVIAGAVAEVILKRFGIDFLTFTESIGEVFVNDEDFDANEIRKNPFFMPSSKAYNEAMEYIKECNKSKDSTGGMIQCVVKNVIPGLGEPVFDKLDALLSQAVMSIGGVKAIEIGSGIEAAVARGSEFNDSFFIKDGKVFKKTNNSGGILAGISDGSSIMVRAYVKPTPSIGIEQDTVNSELEDCTCVVKGRHDTCIVPRVCVVVESMVAITLLDMLLSNLSSRIDNIDMILKK